MNIKWIFKISAGQLVKFIMIKWHRHELKLQVNSMKQVDLSCLDSSWNVVMAPEKGKGGDLKLCGAAHLSIHVHPIGNQEQIGLAAGHRGHIGIGSSGSWIWLFFWGSTRVVPEGTRNSRTQLEKRQLWFRSQHCSPNLNSPVQCDRCILKPK